MHQVINAIVYAEDEEEAMDQARGIFENMVERGIFDYYRTFDEDMDGVSGKSRWGELPACADAGSEEGKKLVDDGMKYTKDEFIEDVGKIRECLSKFSDEEIFSGDARENMLFRSHCFHAGQYKGASVWLYDNDGDGIRTEKEMNDALGKYACLYEDEGKKNPYENDTVWVVPADVHL